MAETDLGDDQKGREILSALKTSFFSLNRLEIAMPVFRAFGTLLSSYYYFEEKYTVSNGQ